MELQFPRLLNSDSASLEDFELGVHGIYWDALNVGDRRW